MIIAGFRFCQYKTVESTTNVTLLDDIFFLSLTTRKTVPPFRKLNIFIIICSSRNPIKRTIAKYLLRNQSTPEASRSVLRQFKTLFLRNEKTKRVNRTHHM